MIFTSYFDESDTHGPAPHIVMAAFVGNTYQWKRFGKRLAKLQRKHQFNIFHSTEFKSRTGEFAGWSDAQSMALIDDLVSLVRDKLTMGLTLSLAHDRFMQEYRSPPIPKKMHLDSHYGACFRGCLAHLIRFVEARGDVDRVNVVFEGGHKNVEDCRRIFNDLRTRFEYVGSYILGTFSVETKESCPPLMVADMLAHTKAMLNARSAEGTAPTEALIPASSQKGALAFLEFAPNSLQELKSNFEILRQRQVEAWRARKLSRKEA